MKINFKTELKTLEGKVIPDGTDSSKPSKNVTLELVSINSLLNNNPQEKIKGEEKLNRYNIAIKIKEAGDMKVEDVSTIKKLIGESYGPLIVGQSFKLLEGDK